MRERGWAGPDVEGETLQQPPRSQDPGKNRLWKGWRRVQPERGLLPWEGRKPATASTVH